MNRNTIEIEGTAAEMNTYCSPNIRKHLCLAHKRDFNSF